MASSSLARMLRLRQAVEINRVQYAFFKYFSGNRKAFMEAGQS
jgi:hypothetical protein